MADHINVLPARITFRSLLKTLTDVKEKLSGVGNERRNTLFREHVFGKWLEISSIDNDSVLLNYIFHHQVSSTLDNMCFRFGGNEVAFGRREFCMVTGFLCHKLSNEPTYVGLSSSPFLDRVFPERAKHIAKKISSDHLLKVFNSEELWSRISDEDAVRVLLLLVATLVFIGIEKSHFLPDILLQLVEDFDKWDNYPWGDFFWRFLRNRADSVIKRKHERDAKKKAAKPSDSKEMSTNEKNPIQRPLQYVLFGFVYAVKVFILEIFPNSHSWWKKNMDVVPRGIAWSNHTTFNKKFYDQLFDTFTKPELAFVPTRVEADQSWFTRSMHYLASGGVVSPHPAEEPVLTSGGADDTSNCVTVNTDEDPKLPSADISLDLNKEAAELEGKQVSHDEDDFEDYSKMPLYDWEVPEHTNKPTSKEDAMASLEAIKATYGILHNRKAELPESLIELEMGNLHSRIQELEKSLLVRYSNNPECASKANSSKSEASDFHQSKEVSAEKHDSTPDHSSLINFAPHQPYSVNDVLNFASNQKCGPVDNFTKVDADTIPDWNFLNNGAGFVGIASNVSHAYNVHDIEMKMLGDDKGVALDGYSLDTNEPLPPVIEASLNETVEGFEKVLKEGNVPNYSKRPTSAAIFKTLKRKGKKSRVFREPYGPLPSTTPRPKKRKTRRLMKNVIPMASLDDGSKTILPKYWVQETGPVGGSTSQTDDVVTQASALMVDCPTVEPWVENLSRASDSNKSRVTNPPYYDTICAMGKHISHIFPWALTGYDVDRDFWLSLLCDVESGWLTDKHLDIWCDLMWHFRGSDADWAIAGPYFSPMVKGFRDISKWPANANKYKVHWAEVERVFIIFNEPKIHYCLGVLNIRTGVITMYDSAGVPENREWWVLMRSAFEDRLPQYLNDVGVLAAKSLTLESYKVRFEPADNVPIQRGPYGDCGIWVCYFLYRLCNNLSVCTIEDPLHVALAYREHMADYLWKYRQPLPKCRRIDDCV